MGDRRTVSSRNFSVLSGYHVAMLKEEGKRRDKEERREKILIWVVQYIFERSEFAELVPRGTHPAPKNFSNWGCCPNFGPLIIPSPNPKMTIWQASAVCRKHYFACPTPHVQLICWNIPTTKPSQLSPERVMWRKASFHDHQRRTRKNFLNQHPYHA